MRKLEERKPIPSPFVWAKLRFHLIEAARIASDVGLVHDADDWRNTANRCTDEINALLEKVADGS